MSRDLGVLGHLCVIDEVSDMTLGLLKETGEGLEVSNQGLGLDFFFDVIGRIRF